MRTKEEILQPYIETPFQHTQVVDKDNALLAMEIYAQEVLENRVVNGFGDKRSKGHHQVAIVGHIGSMALSKAIIDKIGTQNVVVISPEDAKKLDLSKLPPIERDILLKPIEVDHSIYEINPSSFNENSRYKRRLNERKHKKRKK